jgi:SagB-type dehydrogenase family enzyme
MKSMPMSSVSNPLHKLSLESPSELYHEASKLRQSDGSIARTVWCVNTSPQIKEVISNPVTSYRGFPTLSLPTDQIRPTRPLADILLSRRSTRAFNGEALSLSELSAILYYGGGVTHNVIDTDGISWGFRCAPSGGALYPLDLYCMAMRVTGLPNGLLSYDAKAHSLNLIKLGDYRQRLAAITYLTEAAETAAVCILLVANFPKSKFKYGERAYRFVLLEAGHVVQNILLVATAHDLGSLPVGGYVDDDINDIVGANGYEQAVVYAVLVGKKQP